jgi:hypothetical protein
MSRRMYDKICGIGLLQARVGEVEISAELETLIAPALLPRTFINLQVRHDWVLQ